MKRAYIVGAIPVALLVAAVLYLYSGGQTPAGQPPLKSLSAQSVGESRMSSMLQRMTFEFSCSCHQLDLFVCRGPLHSIT